MKKLIILSLALTVIGFSSKAALHTVTVQDFQFSPADMTVNIGDTINWLWMNGSHTTTSMSVPEGASSWNSEINSIATAFSYVVMTAGTYSYNCTIHPTQMTGTFTVVSTTGTSPVASTPIFSASSSLLASELQVNYSLPIPASVTIDLYNITGVRVKNFASAFHTPGEYSETFSVGSLPKGLYFLSLRTENAVVTRKVVME